MDIQVDDIIEPLLTEIAAKVKENALLRAQIKALQRERDELDALDALNDQGDARETSVTPFAPRITESRED